MRPELVSYPKSGRSRIRFGMHHLGLDESMRFHHDGFEFNDGARPAHDFSVEKRLRHLDEAGPTVFLKRDPRDLLVSLYFQVTGRFQDFFKYTGTLSDFVRDPYFGADALRRFFEMWAEVCAQRPVLVVYYEECAVDAAGVFRRIGEHCGFQRPENDWIAAAEASSFENMRRVEDSGEFPRGWLKKRNGFAKVRRGKVGGYSDSLSTEDIAYVNSVFRIESPSA